MLGAVGAPRRNVASLSPLVRNATSRATPFRSNSRAAPGGRDSDGRSGVRATALSEGAPSYPRSRRPFARSALLLRSEIRSNYWKLRISFFLAKIVDINNKSAIPLFSVLHITYS